MRVFVCAKRCDTGDDDGWCVRMRLLAKMCEEQAHTVPIIIKCSYKINGCLFLAKNMNNFTSFNIIATL